MNRFSWAFSSVALGTLLVLGTHVASAADEVGQAAAVEAEAKTVTSVSAIPLAKVLKASRKIDKLIEDGYAKHNVKPNKPVSDDLFVRRIYLDVIGRIPTHAEAREFLDSKAPQKRSQLIDKLLDSEGYVSHNFNYWADLLRLQSRMRYAPAAPYLDFVKTSLRENKPYDQFVRELITAEGYTWDNGAAGYYLRDTGMPLDNMSNTVQVFLGTQLVCAQCHDHPFDSWTQKQYYELAAFTYGIETRDRSNPLYAEMQKRRRDRSMDRNLMQAANLLLRPLAYRVNETERQLRLPDDYQYDDAKPKSPIDPATIFGYEVEVSPGDSRKEIYANWMTSDRNPRFTKVISNRLWKRVMGVGVIEPVDDIKDQVLPSNPKLMAYLSEHMTTGKYDVKQYLRTLFNTEVYQREVTTAELSADDDYYFPGPVLRRLTAEQLWDSMLAMTILHLDDRKGIVPNQRYTSGEDLVEMEFVKILDMAKDLSLTRQMQQKLRDATINLQKQQRVASRTGDREKITKIRAEMAEIRKGIYGKEGEAAMQRQRDRYRQQLRETDPRWVGFRRDMVRASEVTSPARPGHFLRQFGQSDRQTIENANFEATVPQILTLLNGPMLTQLLNRNSALSKNLAEVETSAEKLDVITVSILGHHATTDEKRLLLPEIEDGGPQGIGNVVWALLNTQQFMFVQ